ncbi:MAG TPA: hypothetical protein VF552_15675 [Allosphingosinicella sp.]
MHKDAAGRRTLILFALTSVAPGAATRTASPSEWALRRVGRDLANG